MISFIRTSKKGIVLELILLAVAGISAGCTTKAKTVKKTELPIQQKQTTAPTQTPGYKIDEDPYYERDFYGDREYSTPSPQKSTPANLTKPSFNKIKTGMTLEEVEKLMGEKGMLVSTMDVNGRKTQIYKWGNDNFTSYIDVTIEGGKVVEKKDKGLK
jgi:hypothetical protein